MPGFGVSQSMSFGASGWHTEAPTLYHYFYLAFAPWFLPRVGNGGGKRWAVSPGHLSNDHSNGVERFRLTRKTRPGTLFSHVPDIGHPTPRRLKKLRPFLRRSGV